jgi:hypothetical protein
MTIDYNEKLYRYFIHLNEVTGSYSLLWFDSKFNITNSFHGFKTEARARQRAQELAETFKTKRSPIRDRFSTYAVVPDDIVEGEWNIYWYDTEGLNTKIDIGAKSLDAALLSAHLIWAAGHDELNRMPNPISGVTPINQTQYIERSTMTDTNRIVVVRKTFDQEWQEGVKKFLPEFEYA